MIQDRTSVFPKVFTELAFGLSDVLKVAPFTFYQVYKIFGVARYGVRDFSSFVVTYFYLNFYCNGFLFTYFFSTQPLRKVCIANRNIGQFC